MLLLEDRRFYTYIYLNPLKPGTFIYNDYCFGFEPFYVGKGCGRRMYSHLREAKNILENYSNLEVKINKHKINIINKIKKESKCNPIIVKAKNNLTNFEACKLEKYLIRIIGRNDLGLGPLTNLTNGGDGLVGYIVSQESKDKYKKTISSFSEEKKKDICLRISLNSARTGSMRKGKKYTEIFKNPEEWIKKHGEAISGDKNPIHRKGGHSEETKIKISMTRINKGIAKGINNPRYKEIDEDIVESLFLQGLSFNKIIKEYNKIFNTNIYGHSSIGRVYNKIREKYKNAVS